MCVCVCVCVVNKWVSIIVLKSVWWIRKNSNISQKSSTKSKIILVWFYGSSTLVGYLMPNPFLYILQFFLSLRVSDYCHHLHCYLQNVSADMSTGLLRVFVKLGNLHGSWYQILLIYIHTHTHTHTYIYIYMCVCVHVCVCVCVCAFCFSFPSFLSFLHVISIFFISCYLSFTFLSVCLSFWQ